MIAVMKIDRNHRRGIGPGGEEDELGKVDNPRVAHHEVPARDDHAPDETEDQNVEKVVLPDEGTEGDQRKEPDPEVFLVHREVAPCRHFRINRYERRAILAA